MTLKDDAHDLIRQAAEEVERSRDVIKRTRTREPLIENPATYPRRYVTLTTAAAYLEVDRRTLSGWLDEGKLPYLDLGARRKIALADLLAFEQSSRRAG